MVFVVKRAAAADVDGWAGMRSMLWPSGTFEEHRAEIESDYLDQNASAIGLVARLESGPVIGFAEASLRHDYVNGCHTSPVVFLEGIYVDPKMRRKGVSAELCRAVAAWGRSLGCQEFASDASLDNETSHAMHLALGFEETERVIYFRKAL